MFTLNNKFYSILSNQRKGQKAKKSFKKKEEVFELLVLLTWKTVSRWCLSHDWPWTTGRLCHVSEWSSHLLEAEKEGSASQECVLWYVIAEIIREEQDKREKYFLYIIIASPTSLSINALAHYILKTFVSYFIPFLNYHIVFLFIHHINLSMFPRITYWFPLILTCLR